MQIARNTPAKTPPFIPPYQGAGEYAAKPNLPSLGLRQNDLAILLDMNWFVVYFIPYSKV